MGVQVVRDHDPTLAGDDFLRVHCRRRPDSRTVFTTIERVFGRGRAGHAAWYCRTLVAEAPLDAEAAMEIARLYAARKHVPVVYVEED